MKYKRTVVVLLTLLLLLSLTGCGKQQMIETNYAKPLYGTWQTDVDVTDEAVQTAEEWLGHDVDLNAAMPKLTVHVAFTFNTDGTCERIISQESWAAARLTAEAVLASALTDLTQARLNAAGVGMNVNPANQSKAAEEPELTETTENAGESGKDAESLIEKTFGMSAEEYITRLDLDLIPDYETICERYAFQGNYSVDENGNLTLKAADGTEETVSFLTGNESLVFTTGMNGFAAPVQFTMVE